MKIEHNMYVRTKEGKIFNCFASESMGKPVYYIKDSLTNGFIDYNEAYKVSPNIIDIVQAGDYVNGVEVIDKEFDNFNEEYLQCGVGDYVICTYEVKDIKSIITKEQMEQMAYKVGE